MNKISTEGGQLSESRLSLLRTANSLYGLAGRLVLYRMSCSLATTQIYKNGDYELHCAFYGVQYLPDLLHECH